MNTARDLVTHHFYSYLLCFSFEPYTVMILLREEMLNMHCRTELRKQVDPRIRFLKPIATTDILFMAELLPAILSSRGKAYIHVVVMHMRAMWSVA